MKNKDIDKIKNNPANLEDILHNIESLEEERNTASILRKIAIEKELFKLRREIAKQIDPRR
jgi:hypothetical protein